MVYSPNGTATWFETKEAMAAAGIAQSENFVIDTETGLPVEKENLPSIKAMVQKQTRDSLLPLRSAE
jgi:hypothetical protein